MALLTVDARGVYLIAATPFTEQLDVDYASIDRMVDFYFEKGADGLTILGMMGEAPKLTQAEAVEVTRRAIARSQGKPVIVGISSPGLAAMAELSRAAMDLGAAGVMVAPPMTLRTDDQLVSYYAGVVDAIGSDVPLVVQDFPLVTSVVMAPSVIRRIVDKLQSVVMLKHEDWPGLAKISALRDAEAAGGRRISILCGNGGVFLPEEMARGADGAMTGFAFPEMMVEVCKAAARGDMDRARDVFDAYLPLVRYEQQPGMGLAVRKYVLAKRGAIATSAQRRPGSSLSKKDIAEVETLLARQERRLALL
jgi:4-hydroxy-tetrahydrodipicolinate synthase